LVDLLDVRKDTRWLGRNRRVGLPAPRADGDAAAAPTAGPLRREYVTKSSYGREYLTVTGTLHLARTSRSILRSHSRPSASRLADAAAGFYTPVVRGMHPMSVKMLCLGRHWNAVSYRVTRQRAADVDGSPSPPLPASLTILAREHRGRRRFRDDPDICIVNWYTAASKMGLHQTKTNRRNPSRVGRRSFLYPRRLPRFFRIGAFKRKDPVETDPPSVRAMRLSSAALRDSGTMASRGSSRPRPGRPGFEGRVSLTFREY
jgi:alkylated DNA repair dioxygenase AlkB